MTDAPTCGYRETGTLAGYRCFCNDWEQNEPCSNNCVCLPHSLRTGSIIGKEPCKRCGQTLRLEEREHGSARICIEPVDASGRHLNGAAHTMVEEADRD